MSIVIGGVTCEVMSAGYAEHADQGGQGATRGYLCDWDDRFRVSHALLGLVNYSGSGPGGAITFENPMGLEELPRQVCTGVRHEGKGRRYNTAVGLGFDKCVVWAEYGLLPYSPGGPGGEAQISPTDSFIYCTQEIDSSESYIEIPGQILEYPAGGLSHINRSIQVTVVTMQLSFFRMPYIPMPALAHGGKVNDAVFLGIPRGKVKFDGVRTSRDYDSAGTVLQKATFNFSYRPLAEWNAVPSILLPGTWTLLKYKGTTVYPYEYYDLRSVWPAEFYNSA